MTTSTRRRPAGRSKASTKRGGSLVDSYSSRLKKGRDKRQEEREKRANSRGGDYDSLYKDGVKVMTLKDGDNRIRILPVMDHDHWGITMWVHYGVGPDEQSYLCLDKHKGQPDPIQEEYMELKREGRDKEDLYDYKAKERVLMWVIDRSDEEEGPKLLQIPANLDRDIINATQDPDSGEYEIIEDPVEGFDVIITRTGQAKRTRYTCKLVRKASPLSRDDEEMEEWLSYVDGRPLEDQLNFYDYDHIAKAFQGGASAADEEEEEEVEEEDIPRSRRRRAKEEEPEEEEPEEEESDDADDDAEAAELDDLDEPEEEEPEPPAKRRRSTTTGRRRRRG